MTDTYEYEEWVLYQQLPRDLQNRLKNAVDDESDKTRIAIFTKSDGRSWRFPVQEGGRIAEVAILEICG